MLLRVACIAHMHTVCHMLSDGVSARDIILYVRNLTTEGNDFLQGVNRATLLLAAMRLPPGHPLIFSQFNVKYSNSTAVASLRCMTQDMSVVREFVTTSTRVFRAAAESSSTTPLHCLARDGIVAAIEFLVALEMSYAAASFDAQLSVEMLLVNEIVSPTELWRWHVIQPTADDPMNINVTNPVFRELVRDYVADVHRFFCVDDDSPLSVVERVRLVPLCSVRVHQDDRRRAFLLPHRDWIIDRPAHIVVPRRGSVDARDHVVLESVRVATGDLAALRDAYNFSATWLHWARTGPLDWDGDEEPPFRWEDVDVLIRMPDLFGCGGHDPLYVELETTPNPSGPRQCNLYVSVEVILRLHESFGFTEDRTVFLAVNALCRFAARVGSLDQAMTTIFAGLQLMQQAQIKLLAAGALRVVAMRYEDNARACDFFALAPAALGDEGRRGLFDRLDRALREALASKEGSIHTSLLESEFDSPRWYEADAYVSVVTPLDFINAPLLQPAHPRALLIARYVAMRMLYEANMSVFLPCVIAACAVHVGMQNSDMPTNLSAHMIHLADAAPSVIRTCLQRMRRTLHADSDVSDRCGFDTAIMLEVQKKFSDDEHLNVSQLHLHCDMPTVTLVRASLRRLSYVALADANARVRELEAEVNMLRKATSHRA